MAKQGVRLHDRELDVPTGGVRGEGVKVGAGCTYRVGGGGEGDKGGGRRRGELGVATREGERATWIQGGEDSNGSGSV